MCKAGDSFLSGFCFWLLWTETFCFSWMSGGEFLDVPVQCTIYPVDLWFGLVIVGISHFFGIIIHPSKWQNALWAVKLRRLITTPLLCSLFLLNSMTTFLKQDEMVKAKGQHFKMDFKRISPAGVWSFSAVWELKWHHLPEMRYWPCFMERKIEVPRGLGMPRSPGKVQRINPSLNLH